jgi:NitT/TauT family transport system ATP-binding protein
MNNSNTYLIHLEDVYQRYPSHSSGHIKTVLNDIDLRVREGEFVTVVGPTGCGNSTLLRVILGSEQAASAKKVLIDDKQISHPDRDRGIVFQRYSLFPHLTVLDNVIFGLELEQFTLFERYYRPLYYRKKRKEFKEKGLEYLTRVGLAEDSNKYPFQLSGGMRQRVAIAQALIMRPKVLLMDEPFGALDDSTRQVMQLFILEQWSELKMTVFFVTHDLEEALFLGTRILVLSQYYSTDDERTEGSKIVTDKAIAGGHPKPTNFKYTPEFRQLLEQVRRDGLDPNHRQHMSEFDLSHQDAFRTVNDDEWKR